MDNPVAVMGITSLVFSGIGAYIGAYLREKGKNLATREDFVDLKEQMRQTTRLTEEIKSEVGHAEWRLREIHGLRREKIEEFAQQIATVESKIGDWLAARMRGETFSSPESECVDRLDMLSRLYFPNIFQLSHEYILAWRQAIKLGVEMATKLGNVAQDDLAGRQQLANEFVKIYRSFYPDARQKRSELERALVAEMSQLLQEPA